MDVEATARHEAGHVTAAYLLGWEVSGAHLRATGGGESQILFPLRGDRFRRKREFAVICLAARAHTGWRRTDGDRDDRRQAHQALHGFASDPRQLAALRDDPSARQDDWQPRRGSATSPHASRRSLLEQGRLGAGELETLLAEASFESLNHGRTLR